MQKITLSCFLISAFISCRTYNPTLAFDEKKVPPKPDYSQLKNWAAHPDKSDPADTPPAPNYPDQQSTAAADVFFLHPTSFLGAHKSDKKWNADVADPKINAKTDEGSILFQASIFNGSARVFAPRYRQAHYHAFFSKDHASAEKALDLAYSDVKAAFEYYMAHENKGRPIIIAAHSQGSRHALWLLRDYFDNKPLQKQLVVAYLAGWPVKKGSFTKIKPCENPDQTGCFCSWRTFNRKYGLKHAKDMDVTCTNPIAWTTADSIFSNKSQNLGGIVLKMGKINPEVANAQVFNGFLLCSKPKFPGSFLIHRKNYHPGDFNLYYMNIRQNVATRLKKYSQKQ